MFIYDGVMEKDRKETIHIWGDVNVLKIMFDNIVDNAEKHAFKNNISSNNKLLFVLFIDYDLLEAFVDIYNTGEPLPNPIRI